MVDMEVVVLESKSVLDRSADLGFTYITMENQKEEVMKVSDSECSMNLQNSTTLPHQKRNFSRVIKALFFEAILAKRARDRRGNRQDSSRSSSSNRSLSRSSDERSLNLSPSTSNVQELKTNLEHLHSSSTSTSSSSNSIPESKISSRNLSVSVRQKQRNSQNQDPAVKCCSGFNYGMYLLLISLTVTVLWGRLFGIVFTSIWLYFLPCWYESNNRRPESERKCLSSTERETRDYKKRVIMGGLLQRNKYRGGH
ncbi:hypothetical protein FNV43_RR13501 [Rhamnella rubrinervis]|uniref:Uncharacterized protein n=1 Tax=Rhamnella rubrinervis TaxID=2594499 RepID=A0A8K0MFA2_9ROSA|nr:hypothetical protein FNV43_RR13501 [Rhamnella rubrinervis]